MIGSETIVHIQEYGAKTSLPCMYDLKSKIPPEAFNLININRTFDLVWDVDTDLRALQEVSIAFMINFVNSKPKLVEPLPHVLLCPEMLIFPMYFARLD